MKRSQTHYNPVKPNRMSSYLEGTHSLFMLPDFFLPSFFLLGWGLVPRKKKEEKKRKKKKKKWLYVTGFHRMRHPTERWFLLSFIIFIEIHIFIYVFYYEINGKAKKNYPCPSDSSRALKFRLLPRKKGEELEHSLLSYFFCFNPIKPSETQ